MEKGMKWILFGGYLGSSFLGDVSAFLAENQELERKAESEWDGTRKGRIMGSRRIARSISTF